MLRRLHDYHGWMLAMLDEVEPMLRAVPRPPLPYLAARRAATGRMLVSYQRFVHQEIFDPLIARGGAEDIALVRALKVECIDLAESYRLFLRHWIVEDVDRHWDAYQAAALEMTARLRGSMADVAGIAGRLPPQPGERQPSRQAR